MTAANQNGLDRDKILALPKILLHEHLDCSLRTGSMLEFWQEENWQVPTNFPPSIRVSFEAGKVQDAAQAYQEFLSTDASLSLARYVSAIVNHVCPLMQTAERITRITRERVEDAVKDGVIALELRFAPQLSTSGGLNLEQVMDAIIAGLKDAEIYVKLTLCTLRHENVDMARRLVDLAIQYKDYVAALDLAGDEKAAPGVLLWWANEVIRAREHGIDVIVHLWETDEPGDQDLVRLIEFGIKRLGHGMRGSSQEDRILEVCPSSNVVTGQIKSISEHPIDGLFKQGKQVTVNTDGTLFTCSDLSNEYLLLNRHFGWGLPEFFAVNQIAIAASNFPASVKNEIQSRLITAYQQ